MRTARGVTNAIGERSARGRGSPTMTRSRIGHPLVRSRGMALLAACGSLLLVSCGGGGSTSSTSAKAPLVIRIPTSLSGDFSPLAAPEVKGYQLWAQTVNAHGGIVGRKVVLK